MTSMSGHLSDHGSVVSLPFLQQSIASSILSAALRTLPSILNLSLLDIGYTGSSSSHDRSFQKELSSQLDIPLESPWDPNMALLEVVQILSNRLLSETSQRLSSYPIPPVLPSLPSIKPTRSERDDSTVNAYVSDVFTSLSSENKHSSLPSPLPSPDTRHLLLAGPDETLICALLERLTQRPFPHELETVTVITQGSTTEDAYARLVGTLGSRRYNVPAIMGGTGPVDVQMIGWDSPKGEGLKIKDRIRLEGGIDTVIICGQDNSEEDSIESILSLWKLCLSRRQKNFYLISPRHGPFDLIELPGSLPKSSDVTSGDKGMNLDCVNKPLIERVVQTVTTRLSLPSNIIPLPPLLPHFQHGRWSRSNPLGKILEAGFRIQLLPDISLTIQIPWISLDRAACSIVQQIFFGADREASSVQTPDPDISLVKFISWGKLLDVLKSSAYPPTQTISKQDWIKRLKSGSRCIEDAGMWLEEIDKWTTERGRWDELDEKGEEDEKGIIDAIQSWVQGWGDSIVD